MLVTLETNELLFMASEVSYPQLVHAVAAVTSEPVDNVFLDFDEFLKQHGIRVERESPRLWSKLCFAQFVKSTGSALFYDVVLYLLTKVDRWDVANAVVNELGFVPQTVLDKFRQLPAFLVMPECLASRYTAKELCMMLQTLGDNTSYHCDTMDKAEACQHIIRLLKLRTLPDSPQTVVTTEDTKPDLVLKLRDVFNLGTLGIVDNVHSQPPQRVNDVFVLSFAKLNLVVDSVVRWLERVMLVPASELDRWRRELLHEADDYGRALTGFMYFPREAGPRLQYLMDMNQVKTWAGRLERDRRKKDWTGGYEGIPLPPLAELEQQLRRPQPLFDEHTTALLRQSDLHIRSRRYFQQRQQLQHVGALPVDELQQTFAGQVREKARQSVEHGGRLQKTLDSLRSRPWFHDSNRQHAVRLRSMVERVQQQKQRADERAQQWARQQEA